MMLQVALLQQWTGLQVLRACNVFRAETRTGKTLLIERAKCGRMLEYGTYLGKLVCPAFLGAPVGSSRSQFFEFVITRAEPPTLRQEPVSPTDDISYAARNSFIE